MLPKTASLDNFIMKKLSGKPLNYIELTTESGEPSQGETFSSKK